MPRDRSKKQKNQHFSWTNEALCFFIHCPKLGFHWFCRVTLSLFVSLFLARYIYSQKEKLKIKSAKKPSFKNSNQIARIQSKSNKIHQISIHVSSIVAKSIEGYLNLFTFTFLACSQIWLNLLWMMMATLTTWQKNWGKKKTLLEAWHQWTIPYHWMNDVGT